MVIAVPISRQRPEPWTMLAPGLEVRTVSGRGLGVVGAVRRTAFRLDTDGHSVWLTRDSVFTVDEHVVSLICERNGIPRFEVKARGA